MIRQGRAERGAADEVGNADIVVVAELQLEGYRG